MYCTTFSAVHERSIDSDFLLIILRELLHRRPDLKLILMSATLNARLFAEYFSKFSTTVIDIPGRTFPVERMFLEDAIEQCGEGEREGGAVEAVDAARDDQDKDEADDTRRWLWRAWRWDRRQKNRRRLRQSWNCQWGRGWWRGRC